VGEVRAEILLRGPGDEALRVNGAGEMGMEVAPPFGMRRRKARSAVRSSRAASKAAAAMVVLNSPATTAKRNKTMKAARKMTARTIRRRKACPAGSLNAKASRWVRRTQSRDERSAFARPEAKIEDPQYR
jgi:hypothetical protein